MQMALDTFQSSCAATGMLQDFRWLSDDSDVEEAGFAGQILCNAFAPCLYQSWLTEI